MTTVKHNAMTNHSGAMNPSNLASVAMLAARVLLASIFVLSGLSKIVSQGPTEAYMQALGIPGALLWPAILFGIVAGMLVIMGYQTRIAALLMAGFRLANNINPKHRPAAERANSPTLSSYLHDSLGRLKKTSFRVRAAHGAEICSSA